MRLRRTESRTALSRGCPLRVVASVAIFVALCLGGRTRCRGRVVVKDRGLGVILLSPLLFDASRKEFELIEGLIETPRESS